MSKSQGEFPSPKKLCRALHSGYCIANIPHVLTSILHCIVQVSLTTDDNTVLQAGGECLRSYISVAPQQVASFTDNQV